MRVCFAPDYRPGGPYQQLLADALVRQGVAVEFPRGYRRGLPLSRLVQASRPDLLHLHWPEAYYPATGASALHHAVRKARFPLDLRLATRHGPLALTAHNLWPHHEVGDRWLRRALLAAYRRAAVVFVHSAAAGALVERTFGVEPARLRVVPHGDLSVALPPPIPRPAARERLNLPGETPVCLLFGAIAPYKGIEEVIGWWQSTQPAATLVLAGKPVTDAYAAALRQAAAAASRVRLEFQFLSDAQLALWLSAADCCLFNYREILTSGGACLARSWGVPVLLPSRHITVDLAEPDPRVFRFERLDDSFSPALRAALGIAPDFAAARPWRERCAWDRIAATTANAYRAALYDR